MPKLRFSAGTRIGLQVLRLTTPDITPAVKDQQVRKMLDKPQAASSDNPDHRCPQDVKAAVGNELCLVCGDEVTELQSGPVVCQVCKACYRRCAMSSWEPSCTMGALCQGKRCPPCRFKKCLALGLTPEDACPPPMSIKPYTIRFVPYQQKSAMGASQRRHARHKEDYGEDELVQDFQQNVTVKEERSPDEMKTKLLLYTAKIE